MFPRSLFPGPLFPPPMFPGGGGAPPSQKIIGYHALLDGLRSTLQNVTSFSPINSAVVLEPEPFPLGGTPAAFVMPGAFKVVKGYVDGAGRYCYAVEGDAIVRVVDQSLAGEIYSKTHQLTDSLTSIYSKAHEIINTLQCNFIFDTTGHPLTAEPIIITAELSPKTYKRRGGAGQLMYVDLVCRIFQEYQKYTNINLIANYPQQEATLADVVGGVLSAVAATDVFGQDGNSLFAGVVGQPYPVVSMPYCIVTPGDFKYVQGEVIGGGRDVSTAEGTITLTVVHQSMADVADRADAAITSLDQDIGLLSILDKLVDQTQLIFATNDAGQPVTVEPIRLMSMSRPAYYDQSKSLVYIQLTYYAKYLQKLD